MDEVHEATPTKVAKSKRPKNQLFLSPIEKIFMALIFILSLGGAIGLLLLTTIGVFMPAMGISFLLGIAVATLAYTFLGSKGDDKLVIRGLQMGGAAVVIWAFVYLANDPLDRQLGTVKHIQDLTDQARAAEERANRESVVGHDHPVRIVGGGLVALVDVNTLNGWREGPFVPDGNGFRVSHGDHSVNVNRPGAAMIIETIFRELDIHHPVADILRMSQEQWEGFLRTLTEGKRARLGLIPFATLAIRASDGRVERRTAFRNEEVPVLNRRNRAEAFLCIRRILDTRSASGEPEVVVLSQSTDHCL